MKGRRNFLWITLVLMLAAATLLARPLLSIPSAQAQAQTPSTPQGSQPVVLYFFWGDGCPHCAKAKPFLTTLAQQHPTLEVRAYEVWYDEQNQQLFQRMAAAYGFEPSGVPTIFIGDRYWEGYAEQLNAELEAAVVHCSTAGCRDQGLGIIPGLPISAVIPPGAVANPVAAQRGENAADEWASTGGPDLLTVPGIGTVDLTTQSLVMSTALIALVDGVNPCSLWVLSVLLALTLNTGVRRRVFLVGAVFLTVTSLIYMAFITGLFTMFSVISFVGWIQAAVALVGIFFAAVNIKDYFWYKAGISFTIADEKKPGIYRAMRRVFQAGDSIWGVVVATGVLAAGVSLVEFSCTAGFPVLWTNLLISQQATAMIFVLLLLLYMVIYQIDELGIFLVAVFTLKASRLEEKEGRILKLVGGMLMLTLALTMLINPAWLNQMRSALAVFASAFALAGFVLLIHRKLLPRLGIFIGSELAPTLRKARNRI